MLAQRQHSTIARRQLIALGFTRHAIAQLVERCQLRPVHRGVYVAGPARLTRKGRWMAAVLAAGPGAVLSHRSAAALWRLLHDDGRAVEISAGRSLRAREGVHARFAKLAADEVTTIDGIPVTTVARTLLDLAAVLPRQPLQRAMREAEIRRLADATSLRCLIKRHPRRRGVGNLRELLAADQLDTTITRSELEERFLVFLDDHGLPSPRVNQQIPTAGECDFVWPDTRLVIELDGYATHGTRSQFENDRARDRALTIAGWRVIRITWRQLEVEPHQLAADLWQLFGRAPARGAS